jgi:uncharacterized membrane protein YeaQ/YmgE (transglycosylase-associated protein family)
MKLGEESELTLDPFNGTTVITTRTRGYRMFIVWWIIVGLIAGFLTGKLMKGSGFGPLMDIAVGIVGAILGGFIMRALGFASQGGMIYTILVAVVGAVILTLIVRLVSGGSKRNL